jgi:arylsulfatase A-like enzyme
MRKLHRRSFFGVLAGSVCRAADAQTGGRPNVVLLITDDQGYGDIARHGNPLIRTPSLDALHDRSIRFTDFHVSPTCAPTRASLMTGRYCNATGVWHTIMGRSLLRPGEVTMADCFRNSGYRTGLFGKWHLGDNYPCRPQDRGFQEVLTHGGGGVWQAPDYFGNDYFDDTYLHNGVRKQFRGHCTDVWFSGAMDFIGSAAAARAPFFCYLATNAPHAPMWAPDEFAEIYKSATGQVDPGFYGMITHLDANVGRLMTFLEQRGLAENTILLFMTDNGTAAGEKVFNGGMRGRKGSPYEGGHRVPLFFSWPQGKLGDARNIEAPAAHIDLLPTLIDLCKLHRPSGPPMHGVSLAPVLRGEASSVPERSIVIDSQRLDRLVKWRQTAVMRRQWRLVNASEDGDRNKLELYDLKSDPGQRRNVAPEHPDMVASLSRDYERWWEDTSRGAEKPVRIVIGHRAENPTVLCAHDWHSDGALLAWNQAQIRRGPVANGVWSLFADRAGKYRFELRRWPRETRLGLSAEYRDAEFNREKTPGEAIRVVSARIRIGAHDSAIKVHEKHEAAVFTLELSRGEADLQTWLIDDEGQERGAYYVYVSRL